MEIDITGLDYAQLLLALWKGSKPLGFGLLTAASQGPLTLEQAQKFIAHMSSVNRPEEPLVFDYVQGVPIKVTFHGNKLLRPDLYDRDANGPGSCQRVVDALRGGAPTKATRREEAEW